MKKDNCWSEQSPGKLTVSTVPFLLGHPVFYKKKYFIIDLMHWRHKGSHLHNNDASLVSRSAHVLCWQCARARAGQPGGVACRVCPPGCMLGDDARGSVSFDPQRSWAPFCDVICIWSICISNFLIIFMQKCDGYMAVCKMISPCQHNSSSISRIISFVESQCNIFTIKQKKLTIIAVNQSSH